MTEVVKSKKYEKFQNSIQEMELTSDLFFSVVMSEPAVCQEVVSIIMGQEIRVREVQYQHAILSLTHHSVRIDILAEDMEEKKIGIEMHPQSNENRQRRTRYNLASIDMNTLKTGQEYVELPDAVHIYITQADFLRTGKGINFVERRILGTDIQVCNGVHEYYVCLSKPGDAVEQTELLKYMRNCNEVMESQYFPNLVKRVRQLKEESEGGSIMCEIMERIEREAENRGRILGTIDLMREMQYLDEMIESKLVGMYQLSVETAREYLGYSV